MEAILITFAVLAIAAVAVAVRLVCTTSRIASPPLGDETAIASPPLGDETTEFRWIELKPTTGD